MRPSRLFVTIPLIGVAATLLAVPAGAATAKVGAKCTTSGAKSGTLVCTKKAGILVWANSAAGSASSTSGGVEGTWKPTAESKVGYRAKEVLFGQKTEAVGQTSAVTGTMTVKGTQVTAVSLSADLTTLKSDESRRDNQVKGRILETAKFPKATLTLLKPIDFKKVPADGETVTAKGSVELTLHGVKKTVDVDLTARLKSGKVEVAGAIPLTWADWSITDPSFAGQITVEPSGLLEFLVVFGK